MNYPDQIQSRQKLPNKHSNLQCLQIPSLSLIFFIQQQIAIEKSTFVNRKMAANKVLGLVMLFLDAFCGGSHLQSNATNRLYYQRLL